MYNFQKNIVTRRLYNRFIRLKNCNYHNSQDHFVTIYGYEYKI